MTGQYGSSDTIAGQLARLVAQTTYRSIPGGAIEAAKQLVLDQLGCELVGSTMPWVTPAYELARLSAGARAESSVVNQGFRCLAADAAFVNATYGQACELDDATFGSAGHIGTAVVPAALAVGQSEKISGPDLLTAIVVGYETMYRLMAAMRPNHRVRGFHSQGIGGPFAAAAATAKILGMKAPEITNAFGIAGSHACGPLEFDQAGGEVKRVHAGIAAKGGVQSAFLAKFGLTGPPTIIEGPRGICRIFSDKADLSKIVKDLGVKWNVGNAWFKIYPVVGGIQTTISAIKTLLAKNAVRAEEIKAIYVGITESALLHCAAIRRPHDMVSAQFSLAYSAALALNGKANVLDDYMDVENWRDPEIDSLAQKVEVHADSKAVGERDFMSTVRIECQDGRSFAAVETYPLGSPRNPASRENLVSKFRSLAGAVLTPSRIDAVLETVENIEMLRDVNELTDLLIKDRAGNDLIGTN